MTRLLDTVPAACREVMDETKPGTIAWEDVARTTKLSADGERKSLSLFLFVLPAEELRWVFGRQRDDVDEGNGSVGLCCVATDNATANEILWFHSIISIGGEKTVILVWGDKNC